ITAFQTSTGQKTWSNLISGENACMAPGENFKIFQSRNSGRECPSVRVVHGGRIYIHNRQQELVAVNIADGKVIFRKDLKAALGAEWSIRLAAGGKVFVHTRTPSPNPKTFKGDMGQSGGGPFEATSEMANFH